MGGLRTLLAGVVAAVLVCTVAGHAAAKPLVRTLTSDCQSAGVQGTTFPGAGAWTTVNAQTFDGRYLPRYWGAFLGWYDGVHHSYREPSNLVLRGSWMEFRNYILHLRNYHVVADAGVDEYYPATRIPGTHRFLSGYDDAAHEWGFQWCARINPGPNFDTAFAFVPTDGEWPPEIDFIEHSARFRNLVSSHIHWSANRYHDGALCDPRYPTINDRNCHADFRPIPVQVGQWTAYAVTWSHNAIDVWIDGKRIAALTVTATTCDRQAATVRGEHDTGSEPHCLSNGYVNFNPRDGLQPYEWDMQVNSTTGVNTYGGDQTDLAWFEALRPQ